jgi:lipopolysaccharide/colanic/teichoic acid biosynthesis glycosyltransferase
MGNRECLHLLKKYCIVYITMTNLRAKELTILLVGDITLLYVALWLTLGARYFAFPSPILFYTHAVPFSFLFLVSITVFFIAGLYDKQTTFLKHRLPGLILYAQIMNSTIAVLFFFFVPSFGIQPKTNLVLYLVISVVCISAWRLFGVSKFVSSKRLKALLIGEGSEVEELIEEVNANPRYDFEFVRAVDPALASKILTAGKQLEELITKENIAVVVADARNSKSKMLLPFLYEVSFLNSSRGFIDLYKIYEEIFDRTPLSLIDYDWFLEHIPRSGKMLYDSAKRFFDIFGGLLLGACALVVLPFVFIALKSEGTGAVFISQERIGQNGRRIKVYKFRTMKENEATSNAWVGESKNKVTKVGSILRHLSIDEWPQSWNILKGEMSLIGPRNDILGIAERLSDELPYYSVRYMVKPGITGWAQTHQVYASGNISPQSIEESRLRLAYDIFYVKNRSIMLDMNIALRTLGTLLSRFGVRFGLR